MKNRKKEKIILSSLIAITIVGIVIGISYAFIMYSATQQSINKLSTNCVQVDLVDDTDAINLEGAYPISDEKGANTTPYRFTITNTCNVNVDYSINLEVLGTENRIESNNISAKVNYNETRKLTDYSTKTPTYVGDDYTAVEGYSLVTGSLNASDSVTHSLRLWLNADAGNDTQNKIFYSKVVVEAVQNDIVENYKEDILNGADPVLADNLVPVVIAADGTVTKANVKTEWYNYENKVWANAVILEDERVTYNNYDVIPEENIESYFVWIPRYSYQIWDLGEYDSVTEVTNAEKPINIKFGTNTTSDSVDGECTTPNASGDKGNCQVNDYMTHPAFTSFGTNGIWVGKFETGYKGATSTSGAQSNSNDSDKIEIKPNVYSWRSIQVANAYSASRTYKADLNSHMMKNTEWGAVAYLQHSAYGSQASVRINNNSNYITGYAAVNEPTCGYTGKNEDCNKYEGTALSTDGTYTINYLNTASVVASTTGNYSGVYDMSGGAWEYMMGVLADTNGNPMSGRNNSYNSGFKGTYGCPGCDSNDSSITSNTTGADFPTDARYYDLYKYGTANTTYNNRILGDATGEMGPFGRATYGSQTRQISSWYADEAWFVDSHNPWFERGGAYVHGTSAGVFDFGDSYGHASGNYGFRVVLAA